MSRVLANIEITHSRHPSPLQQNHRNPAFSFTLPVLGRFASTLTRCTCAFTTEAQRERRFTEASVVLRLLSASVVKKRTTRADMTVQAEHGAELVPTHFHRRARNRRARTTIAY